MDKVEDAKQRLADVGTSSQAVALYAIGARDTMDFIDLVGEEESMEVLLLLHSMLVADNPSPNHDADLNKILAPIVERVLERNGYRRG